MPRKNPIERNKYVRELQKARRLAWLEANGPCANCGRKAEEVDHIDPTQKTSHRIWVWSESRRAAELAKCQPLCIECHKKKTAEDRASKVQHGTSTMYDYRGCRCDACREFKSKKNKTRYE